MEAGDVQGAISLLERHCPELLSPGSPVYLCLYVQAFIELLRSEDTAAALHSAQRFLRPFKNATVATCQQDLQVREVMGLLLHHNPQETSVGFLLSQGQRTAVFLYIQAAIHRKQSSASLWHQWTHNLRV